MCVCTPALVPGLSVSLPSTLGEHSLTLFSEILEGLAFIGLFVQAAGSLHWNISIGLFLFFSFLLLLKLTALFFSASYPLEVSPVG